MKPGYHTRKKKKKRKESDINNKKDNKYERESTFQNKIKRIKTLID